MIIALITLLVVLLVAFADVFINLIILSFFRLLYRIATFFFMLLDFCQDLFRKLAGLDEGVGDILLDKILMGDTVKNTVIALTVLAIILLFVFTLIQMVRLEYTTEGSQNAKGPVIRSALKSLGLFFVIPLLCMLGIYVSSTLLGFLDQATRGETNDSIAGYIFRASVYEANPIRQGESEWAWFGWGNFFDYAIRKFGDPNADQLLPKDRGLYKIYVDGSTIIADPAAGQDSNVYATADGLDNIFCQPTYGSNKTASGDFGRLFGKVKKDSILNYSNINAVTYFYNIMSINYFIIFICAPFAIATLYKSIFGLVMRIYTVALLYMISPPIVALTPLDGGNAFKNWRQKFLGAAFSAYGVVIGLNLFFQILPLLTNIKLYTSGSLLDGFFNALIHLIFILVGCLMIKDFSKTISGILGVDDVLEQGEGMSGQVSGIVKNTVTKAGGMALGVGMIGTGLAMKGFSSAAGKRSFSKAYKQDEKADRLEELQNMKEPLSEKQQKEKEKLEKGGSVKERRAKSLKHTQKGMRASMNSLRGGRFASRIFQGTGVGKALGGLSAGMIFSENRQKFDKDVADTDAKQTLLKQVMDQKEQELATRGGRRMALEGSDDSGIRRTLRKSKVTERLAGRGNVLTQSLGAREDFIAGPAREKELTKQVMQEIESGQAGQMNLATNIRQASVAAMSGNLDGAKVFMTSAMEDADNLKEKGLITDAMLDALQELAESIDDDIAGNLDKGSDKTNQMIKDGFNFTQGGNKREEVEAVIQNDKLMVKMDSVDVDKFKEAAKAGDYKKATNEKNYKDPALTRILAQVSKSQADLAKQVKIGKQDSTEAMTGLLRDIVMELKKK